MKNNLIIIAGPTATKKSHYAIELAKRFSLEVINFDSLCFYKELLIGTSRPHQQEMQGVPHHLVGEFSAHSPLNAADFVRYAHKRMNQIYTQGKIPILVGGSGFYLRALIKGMYDSENVTNEIRQRVETIFEEEGIAGIRARLEKIDPESCKRLHVNDHYRNKRALEHFYMTGTKFTDQKMRHETSNSEPPWNLLPIYLDIEKGLHWKIIEQRCKMMVDCGLIEEVRELLQNGFSGKEKPLQSIGYKETISYINGEFDTLESYIERLVINTRRLAKSQRTFFKQGQNYLKFDPLQDEHKIIQCVQKFMGEE